MQRSGVVEVAPAGGMSLSHLEAGIDVDGAKEPGHQVHQVDMHRIDLGEPLPGSGLDGLGGPRVARSGGYAEDGEPAFPWRSAYGSGRDSGVVSLSG